MHTHTQDHGNQATSIQRPIGCCHTALPLAAAHITTCANIQLPKQRQLLNTREVAGVDLLLITCLHYGRLLLLLLS
jgi:hypothetical protein